MADKRIHRFRPVIGNINADLPHYLNGLRSNAARLHAGAFNFKSVSAVMPKDAFGILIAAGFPGTRIKYSILIKSPSFLVSGPPLFLAPALGTPAPRSG